MGLISHRFFCVNCGTEGLPIYRNRGHLHKSGHLKKLFCYKCGKDMNHVECANDSEVKKFKEDFKNGVYKNEAEKSLHHVSPAWER